MVGTGIYNLVNSVAYRVPLSPDQVTRLFRLPYAQPYYLSLAVKLAAYAVMIGATIPLIAEARRRAAVDDADAVVLPAEDHSPWEKPERASDDSPSTGGRLALRQQARLRGRRRWLGGRGAIRRAGAGSGGDYGGRRDGDHGGRDTAQVLPSPGGAVPPFGLRSPGSSETNSTDLGL